MTKEQPMQRVASTTGSCARDHERWLVRHSEILAVGLTLLVTASLLVLATTLHPVEVMSAEYDGFVGGADTLLAGHWPRDPFRPMLYVLLVAGMGWITGDCFLAAKLVSALAGGVLVFVVYRLGRRVHDRPTGLLAALLVGIHANLIEHGMLAATDCLFTLTFTMAVLASVRAAHQPGSWPAARVGLCFALAWFTRYTAVALLPVVVLATVVGARPGTRLRRLFVCGAAMFVGLVPHMTLSHLQFGKPFHDENWRSLALRHFGTGDWSYLFSNPFDGTWSVLRHDPGLVWRHFLDELGTFGGRGLRELLATWAATNLVGWGLVALLLLGLVFGWQRRARAVGHMVLALGGYLLLVSATFFTWTRLLVPILPGLLLLVAWSTLRVSGLGSGHPRWRPFRCWSQLVGVSLVVMAVLTATPKVLRSFVASHPLGAIEAARQLARAEGEKVVILTDFPYLHRHAPCRDRLVHIGTTATDAYSRVTDALLAGDGDYLLLSRHVSTPESWTALASAALPRCLELLRDEPDLRVCKVRHRELQSMLSTEVELTQTEVGTWTVRCELRPEAPSGTRLRLAAYGPRGEEILVDLTASAERRYGGTVGIAEGTPAGWRVVVRAMTPDGELYASKSIPLRKAPTEPTSPR